MKKTLATLGTLALTIASTQAETFIWTGLGTGTSQGRWTNAGNWENELAVGQIPTSTTETDLIFPETGRDGANVFGNFTVRSITYDSTIVDNQSANIHRGNTQARNITFDADIGNAQLVVEAGAIGSITYNNILAQNGFILNDPLDIVHNGDGTLVFNVPIKNGSSTGNGINKSGTGTLSLNGAASYTGDTIVAEGTVNLGIDGTLNMVPLENGINNVLAGVAPGSGTLNLNGTLKIDLTGANPAGGNSWLLVDASNLAASSYGETFLVSSQTLGDFTENVATPGIWVLNDGSNEWTFTEAAGTLTVAPASNVKYWTGFTNGIWDTATTANFSNNPAAAPLDNTTFDVATALTSAAFFADFYEENGGTTAVTENSITIASGGVETGTIGFLNTETLDYTISATDNGITGATEVALRGSGTVTFLGAHPTTGPLSIDAGNTLNIGDGMTDGLFDFVSSFTNDGTLVIDRSQDIWEVFVGIDGTGSLEKKGPETLTFVENNTYTGPTTISAGTLIYEGTALSDSHEIAAGATLNLFNDDEIVLQNFLSNLTFTGGGNIVKTGFGVTRFGGPVTTYELGSGALIDVQGGTIRAGNNANEVWTNNLADLNLEAGTNFIARVSGARFDELTGSGTLSTGTTSPGYIELTMGVDNGTATFDGVLANNADDVNRPGNYVKVGTGTQTLAGLNTYTGDTRVEEGTLTLSGAGSLTFYPTTDAVTNQIMGIAEGTGIINLDGEFNLNLSVIDLTPGNSWLLIDDTDLTVNFGSTFSVNSSLGAFTETSPGVWELDTLGSLFTFTESTYTLGVAAGTPAPPYTAWWITNYRTLSDITAAGDPDGDGIANVLEYVLNGNPQTSDLGILPTLDASGTDFVFTFERQEVSDTDTTQVFQYGSDLVGWTDVNITAPTAPEVNIGTAVDGMQTVTVTVSKSLAVDGELYGRLIVTLDE